jgi:hypothetical protein
MKTESLVLLAAGTICLCGCFPIPEWRLRSGALRILREQESKTNDAMAVTTTNNVPWKTGDRQIEAGGNPIITGSPVGEREKAN